MEAARRAAAAKAEAEKKASEAARAIKPPARTRYNRLIACTLVNLAGEAAKKRPIVNLAGEVDPVGLNKLDPSKAPFSGYFDVSLLNVDTQGFIAKDVNGLPGVVLAFRGSEGMPWDLGNTAAMRDWIGTNFMAWRTGVGVKVHSGFLLAYLAVRSDILLAIKNLKPRHVYVTGHSLGAALATLAALAALDIQLHSGLSGYSSFQVTMYNFGSPRVGNSVFAGLYNALVRDSHRVVHDSDPVTQLPFSWLKPGQYVHIGVKSQLERHPESKIHGLGGESVHDPKWYKKQLCS